MKQVLITGVSSGIGHGLACELLHRDATVYGVSRRTPEDLLDHERFHFQSLDLCQTETIESVVRSLVPEAAIIDLVILNAGRLGTFSDMRDAELGDLQKTMTINVWCNKFVIDALTSHRILPRQVVAISSGASVNGNRGWSGYSISKAALNMFVKLYAREQPATHWCALAPGLVDTEIQSELRALPPDGRFPGLDVMRQLRGTEAMPQPGAIAGGLLDLMFQLPELVESGSYADIRQPPLV